ncbi:hypothetical protein [Neisseria sp. 83E34]|uniref:hypothetical protein n=1 Tax=Neisseria sp. 83E34 TaxID=1692264 RepID=UPI0006CE62BC|nr:hypothetical protein [Neisseria sp. 83E34]KPN71802.1 hypothetical protein AKG09_05900 [Neisseria sp. 83E34]
MIVKNILSILALCALLSSCQPNTNKIEKTSSRNNIEKKVNNISKNVDNAAPYNLQIGSSSVTDALSMYPNLNRADSSYIRFGKNDIPMPNSYWIEQSDGSTVVFQFDDNDNILQNVLILNLTPSFKEVTNSLNQLYSSYNNLTLEEFEALSGGETTFENHELYLKRQKDKIAFFKQGNILIIAAISENGKTFVSYRNIKYIKKLKEKEALLRQAD